MKIIDANNACSKVAYLFSEVCSIYPITPSSPMAENIDNLSHTELNNIFNVKPKVVEMESEAGAAGALHGALISGSLASTFTASQGLLLMIPNMYKIAGEKLPGVMHVASRTLATHALSIFGDHSDIYSVRDTGWCMIASNNATDAQNLSAVAHLCAIKSSLPFIHFFDGFRTSHELNTVEDIDNEKLLSLVDKDALEKFRNRALNIGNNVTYGTSQTEDVFFECMEAKNNDYENVCDIVNDYMQKINELTNSNYKPFNYYGNPNAENVIVAMGSVSDTIKSVIENNPEYGFIEVHLFRPFSSKYLLNVLPKTVKNIAVLDRAKSHGSREALYLDVVEALKNRNINIIGGRYGLSSKNTTPAMIKAVFDNLENEKKDNFTIGIDDDVTNLSLNIPDYHLNTTATSVKIYGFGSDGMVSASKDLLHILYDKKKMFVQGYFEYDSKKSGGVTISHLRYDNKKINMPYYIENPSLIVVTKEEYFKRFDMLSSIKENGTLLVNTILNEEEFNKYIPTSAKRVLLEKHINVYTVNASKISYNENIKGKISKIMEVLILKLLGIDGTLEIIESIKEQFKTKGDEIINSNINAVNSSLNEMKKIEITNVCTYDLDSSKNVFDKMNKKEHIKVSDVIDISSGALPGGLSKNEKRDISTLTPLWNPEKCIECGMCAVVCPHAAIRNFVTKDKSIGKEVIGNPDYNFVVGISKKDCTGCTLCTSICPTKSLSMERKQEPTDSLFETKNDELFNKFTIKGSQLCTPKFEYSGACSGCGETPYIKLLTQLFGENIVIANATGCSSIYGASSPSTPYLIPWANSLFEDNAEFALGINTSYENKKEQLINEITNFMKNAPMDERSLCSRYLENIDDEKITLEVAKELESKNIPDSLKALIPYMPKRTVWALGGDGWAYDIGYNGIDHVLHSGENVKILVLDTEVYSNTGGQSSKSTKLGAVAQFAGLGKKTNKKDLFRIASQIDNVYVASVSLGANMMQTITAFKEASEHKGPSIIICYCPCIEHGIKGGMVNSINEEKLAVECGYTILMRSINGKLSIDSKEPDFNKYEDFLNNEVRFSSLKIKNPEIAKELLDIQKENAIKRYEYYIKQKN